MLQATAPQNNDHIIVRFTNISDFDFTPEMGAMYGGVPYFVSAGKSMLMPKSFGDHLAIHLARQIIIKKAPIRDEKEVDGKGTDRKLWDQAAIDELKAMIVSQQYEEERPAPTTPEEIMKRKVEELNKQFPPEVIAAAAHPIPQGAAPVAAAPAPIVSPATFEPAPAIHVGVPADAPVVTAPTEPAGYKDKAEVIEALKAKDIKFDARKSKAELEKLLN